MRGRKGRSRRDDEFPRYVPVAERRREAGKALKKLAGKGQATSPVVIRGTRIATTFWGKAWCENLERYSDFSNRLPRGRTYVRNGSVLDLQVLPGKVVARVSGTSLYQVEVVIAPVPPARWRALCRECGGAVDSLVELLQGRFSRAVMERICRQGTGLFPAPAEIRMSCSCPDWATMCKHVAAVLYGIGARLDEQPELLFRLRQVDENDLVAQAGTRLAGTADIPASGRVVQDEDLSALFGVEMAPTAGAAANGRAAGAVSGGAGRVAARKPAARFGDLPTVDAVLPKGTRVRMLSGMYRERTGVITWIGVKGDKVTYAVTFSTDGTKATTQVARSSIGRTWELAGPVPAVADSEPERGAPEPRPFASSAKPSVVQAGPGRQGRAGTEAKSIVGTWRIGWMAAWDQDVIDQEASAFIKIDRGCAGRFGFAAVRGEIDGRVEIRDGRPSVEFTWAGIDDGHPCCGRGWAALLPDGSLEGHLYFHQGDDSAFRAAPFGFEAGRRETIRSRRPGLSRGPA